MYNPEKEQEQTELEELIEKEIQEDYDPDYQQYITLRKV